MAKPLTLGGVIEKFDHLYPNELDGQVKRRVIWLVDRAFAIETGQKEPPEYLAATPKNTQLLAPKVHEQLYIWALLRQTPGGSEGQKEYYNDRYQWEKRCAVSVWRDIHEGGNGKNETDTLWGREPDDGRNA